MIRKIVASSIAAVTTLGAMPVLAQSTAGIEAIEEIEVISRSRRSEGLADLNAAVSVIGAEELSRVAQMHYQQALNRLPGVNIHRNNGQESLAAIRSPVFTGAGACGAFLVAENGIPVRSHGFCNVNEMFDTHSESADRIEVVRGPGSAFWGSNAVHGLINVVLPEPGEAKSLRLEKGPRGTYRGNARLGSENGNFKQLFLVNGVNEKGYQEESGFDQQKLSWLYNYDAGGGTEIDGGFTLINLNQETAGYIVGTDVYKDGDLRKRNPNPGAYRDSKNHRVWTTISHQNENWEFVFTPYWREVNMNFIQHFLPGQPVEDFQHTTLGFQGAGYRTLDNGAVLAIGMDLEDTSAQLLQYQPNPTQGSFFLRNSIPQGRHYDFEVEARQLAAFVNYEQSFASGWELSLGLRLEDVDYEYDNLMIDGRTNEFGVPCRFGCRYNRPSDRADSFTNLSPKLGLSYTLSDYANLQLRVQRGFRAPQATELYRLQNAQTVADLESVELDSYEIAVNGAGLNWDYSVSLYRMNKDNGIITNSSRENLNGSNTQHQGLEASYGHSLTDTLSIRGVANFAKHTYENSIISGGVDIKGNDIDTSPNLFGNLRLIWQPLASTTLELEWANMGEYYTNPENTAEYEGHDLLNLRGQYRFSEDVTVSLNVLNLTNELYAERADWTTFTGDRYFPGQEARAFLAVQWDFL